LGVLREGEREEFITTVEEIFEKRGIQAFDRPWVSDNFKVLQECSIITGSGKERRPDYAMIDEAGNAKIIDFKTGKKDENHRKQLDNYIELLHQMGGFNSVEGSLWYLFDNEEKEANNE